MTTQCHLRTISLNEIFETSRYTVQKQSCLAEQSTQIHFKTIQLHRIWNLSQLNGLWCQLVKYNNCIFLNCKWHTHTQSHKHLWHSHVSCVPDLAIQCGPWQDEVLLTISIKAIITASIRKKQEICKTHTLRSRFWHQHIASKYLTTGQLLSKCSVGEVQWQGCRIHHCIVWQVFPMSVTNRSYRDRNNNSNNTAIA